MVILDEAGTGIDRISDFPDPILCKIISSLSTKNAVATKILSKRWKHLFPSSMVSPIHLTFNDTDLFTHFKYSDLIDLLPRFTHFVDTVLLYETSLDVPLVESMNLYCRNRHGIDKITSWVSTSLQLGVRSLILELALDGRSRALFDALNGGATLVSLSLRLNLWGETMLSVPDNFSLPNLNKLRISGVVFDDDDNDGDSMNKCLNGCPVFEDLSLVDCEFHVSEVIFIRSRLLKCLTIDSSEYAGFCLDLDALNLQVLKFRCSAARRHRTSDF